MIVFGGHHHSPKQDGTIDEESVGSYRQQNIKQVLAPFLLRFKGESRACEQES
jgi:hypothetical protein